MAYGHDLREYDQSLINPLGAEGEINCLRKAVERVSNDQPDRWRNKLPQSYFASAVPTIRTKG